jgi:acetyl-CoA synthetase
MSEIESLMHEHRVFPPSTEIVKNAAISGMDAYLALCREAEQDYEGFWRRLATEHLNWQKPFSRVLDESQAPFYKWFDDGELNVSHNCLDRHLDNGNADKTAIIFEADDGTVSQYTYRQLHAKVCQLANGLKSLGIKLRGIRWLLCQVTSRAHH